MEKDQISPLGKNVLLVILLDHNNVAKYIHLNEYPITISKSIYDNIIEDLKQNSSIFNQDNLNHKTLYYLGLTVLDTIDITRDVGKTFIDKEEYLNLKVSVKLFFNRKKLILVTNLLRFDCGLGVKKEFNENDRYKELKNLMKKLENEVRNWFFYPFINDRLFKFL